MVNQDKDNHSKDNHKKFNHNKDNKNKDNHDKDDRNKDDHNKTIIYDFFLTDIFLSVHIERLSGLPFLLLSNIALTTWLSSSISALNLKYFKDPV